MKTFTEEDLVPVYCAGYESCGDIWMCHALKQDTLTDYEFLKSEGYLSSIYSFRVLKDSAEHKRAIEGEEHLQECISELREEKEND